MLCVSFHSHWSIHAGVTVRQHPIRVKIDDFFPVRPYNLTKDLKHNNTPLLCYSKLCASFHSHLWIQNWNNSPETLDLDQNRRFFVPCDLEIWRMSSKNNMAPLQCYFRLCVSFHSHWWIQTGVKVRKRPIWVKIGDCFVLTFVTLAFDLWPRPFAWTSLLTMVINLGHVMIRW